MLRLGILNPGKQYELLKSSVLRQAHAFQILMAMEFYAISSVNDSGSGNDDTLPATFQRVATLRILSKTIQ